MTAIEAKQKRGAQYFMPMKDGITPQLFYRFENIKYNDGTIAPRLQYLSTCGGGWMGSMENDEKSFVKNKLVKI